MKYLLLSLLLLAAPFCQPEPLKISRIIHCENFNSHGKCREPSQTLRNYQITLPPERKISTWKELGNYLYFHSRQTPGLILKLNRPLTMTETRILKKTFKAYYEFSGSRGRVEGLEIGKDWLGIFQYLGSMLKQKMQQERKENSSFSKDQVFPTELKFFYQSDLFQGEIQLQVDLQIQP